MVWLSPQGVDSSHEALRRAIMACGLRDGAIVGRHAGMAPFIGSLQRDPVHSSWRVTGNRPPGEA